jgi:hypothetical protein
VLGATRCATPAQTSRRGLEEKGLLCGVRVPGVLPSSLRRFACPKRRTTRRRDQGTLGRCDGFLLNQLSQIYHFHVDPTTQDSESQHFSIGSRTPAWPSPWFRTARLHPSLLALSLVSTLYLLINPMLACTFGKAIRLHKNSLNKISGFNNTSSTESGIP